MTVDQNGKLFALLMVAMDASFYVSIQTVTLILNSGSTLGSVVLDSLANYISFFILIDIYLNKYIYIFMYIYIYK